MNEWTSRPAEYWRKRSMMDENYLDTIITIIGAALPSIQNNVEALDEMWNAEISKLDAEYPVQQE